MHPSRNARLLTAASRLRQATPLSAPLKLSRAGHRHSSAPALAETRVVLSARPILLLRPGVRNHP